VVSNLVQRQIRVDVPRAVAIPTPRASTEQVAVVEAVAVEVAGYEPVAVETVVVEADVASEPAHHAAPATTPAGFSWREAFALGFVATVGLLIFSGIAGAVVDDSPSPPIGVSAR
jgi:hypothetical protein